MLAADSKEGLHTVYGSPDTGHFDVENVLLYNVGNFLLRSIDLVELIVEKRDELEPAPPPELHAARHAYLWEIVTGRVAWSCWAATRPIATLAPPTLTR